MSKWHYVVSGAQGREKYKRRDTIIRLRKMRKIIRLEDLDIVKEQKRNAKKQKETEKQFEKWATRYCFVCNQKMKHVGGLVWQCERCDTFDVIEHVVLPYGRNEHKDKRRVFLE